MMPFAWAIPLFPLASFLCLLLFGKRLGNRSAAFAIGFSLLSFVLSITVLIDCIMHGGYKAGFTWLDAGSMKLSAGLAINQLNALMLAVVSLVSLLVHLYSMEYMKGDQRYSVFFSYLGLFSFAMLGLVMSPNLLQLYLFWELVGLGSFLLIGFYFYKEEAKAAAKKAFIMTRIGDVGLFIGMILLFWQTGSFEWSVIFEKAGSIPPDLLTAICILIFIGAMGKSGQFPLHTWLPDAMEGPTPVSALIHAATMVAAGVYLVAAAYPLFELSPASLSAVAAFGGFTAIFAASIGLVQTDIKRVLAYSTVSQLGYMMLALGAGSYEAGVFHLVTHAFFKALLFLAAGSVIHAVHTQNIREMGGLWKKLRFTGPLFLIGALSISGFPLLSGFFSKDEILAAAWNGNPGFFWVAVVAAFFTSFYMFRLFFLIFTGEEKAAASPKEPGAAMLLPMLILGVLAVFAGYMNTPWFGTFLSDWLNSGHPAHHDSPAWIMILASAVSLLGILLAYLMYGKGSIRRDFLSSRIPGIHRVLYDKYYMDDIYGFTFIKGVRFFAGFLEFFDRYLVGGVMKGIAGFISALGNLGSRVQSGNAQTYAAAAFAGLAVLLLIFAAIGGYLL
ncbi:NADH-quinone oxidoreductase subunit L [Metabacillus sp. GX 13764]|uniref:NADH-quinone oxidoreductase subunit L n=1 Tax=Metabacillus kandeliae TaxID=2900151 RepID=UPI001E637751|nr:NADH-quinone oxidoreductase subunit L [Metabacillus kandeliae]MCD7034649.1 NADH-quinone oxidoreductase subunit L [Metabacillus kandeliae]